MKNNKPLISVLVPVYNTKKYLKRCFDSIRMQQFNDFEVIIVDDGSVDGSSYICDEYLKIDSRFKVIHKKNEGIAKTRLLSYKEAQGKYFVFIDSDDYLLPDSLCFLFNEIEKGYDIVRSVILRENSEGIQWIDHYPFEKGVLEGYQDYMKAIILDKISPYLHSAIYRADLFKEDIFIVSSKYGINIGEDWIANYLISKNIDKVLFVDKPTYVYCVNRDSTMKTYIRGWEYQNKISDALNSFNSQLNYDMYSFVYNNSCINRLKYFFLPELSFNWTEYKKIEKNIDIAVEFLSKDKYIPNSYLYFIHHPLLYFIYTRLYCIYFFILHRKCRFYKVLK